MRLFQASAFTSLLTFTSYLLLPVKAQRGPLLLTADELLPYQICTTNADCISGNNGVCDCANGGEEVSINKLFSDEFKDLFPPMFCTQLAPEIPCGTGAGNVCINSQCVFQECADKRGAQKCDRAQKGEERENCFQKACSGSSSAKPDVNVTETGAIEIVPIEPDKNVTDSEELKLPKAVRTSLMEKKKFITMYLKEYQYCETDEECVYANNGFCDCANGGEEVAINVNELETFEAIFDSWDPGCSKRGRTLPCGIGAGVVCGEKKLCEFKPCKNLRKVRMCQNEKNDFEREMCAREACAEE